ncbi:protein of unknown function [Aminobacter niigataensis]|nr:protein of unknown function [Aminobacter niigataensis]
MLPQNPPIKSANATLATFGHLSQSLPSASLMLSFYLGGSSERLPELSEKFIDQIYEASFVPEKWPTLLDGLAHAVEGMGGYLFTISQGASAFTASEAVAAHVEAFMREGWMVSTRAPHEPRPSPTPVSSPTSMPLPRRNWRASPSTATSCVREAWAGPQVPTSRFQRGMCCPSTWSGGRFEVPSSGIMSIRSTGCGRTSHAPPWSAPAWVSKKHMPAPTRLRPWACRRRYWARTDNCWPATD